MKTAIVIGATGLIGKHLTNQLLKDGNYGKVKIIVRRSSGITNPKLEENIVDFDEMEKWSDKLTGDVIFSAMGTTIKKAGNKEAQYKIDFTYQYEVARAAAYNGVGKYIIVSSAGANSNSNNFYLRMKGELEEELIKLPFKEIVILQPSLLSGNREEERAGEKLGAFAAKLIIPLLPPLRKYRPIPGDVVASAMINAAKTGSTLKISKFVLDEIFSLSGK